MMQSAMGIDSMQWDDPLNSDKVNTLQNVAWKIVDEVTKKEGMNIDDWTFAKDQLVKIRLTNDPMAMHIMQHPIHLHGQRFVVLSNNGIVNQNMVWKDTALVPPGEYIDILVDMSNSGEWMLHCHISEHLHAGMMMPFRVEDQNGSAVGDSFRESVTPATTEVRAPLSSQSFSYTDTIESIYKANINLTRVPVGKKLDLAFSFSDSQNVPVNLSDSAKTALQVTFLHEDGVTKVVTYPGNKDFDSTPAAVPTPASDGHNHLHFLGAQTAYAHGDSVTDGHHVGTKARTYTVSVVFPKTGSYKAFVEFVLEGETSPRVVVTPLTVRSWSIDDFGWTSMILGKSSEWWILLIVSVLFIIPLSLVVRKYIKI
jgi:uncharacterized cupredoxin-like copper-binding protein